MDTSQLFFTTLCSEYPLTCEKQISAQSERFLQTGDSSVRCCVPCVACDVQRVQLLPLVCGHCAAILTLLRLWQELNSPYSASSECTWCQRQTCYAFEVDWCSRFTAHSTANQASKQVQVVQVSCQLHLPLRL